MPHWAYVTVLFVGVMGHGFVAEAQSNPPDNGNKVYLELGVLGFIVPAHHAAMGAGGIFQVAAGDSGFAFELRYAAGGPNYDSNFFGGGMNLHWPCPSPRPESSLEEAWAFWGFRATTGAGLATPSCRIISISASNSCDSHTRG